MKIFRKIKREIKNITTLNAYSFWELAEQAYLFPYDYYIRKNEKSSSIKNIALFVTLRCNARCKMCNLSELLNNQAYQDLGFEKISYFVNSVKKEKPGIILFGGEPFIRQDIFDIIKLVKDNKMSCGIFTNGVLLNQEKINKIIDLKLNYLAFSLQGIGETHDKIVNVNGAFEIIKKNIEYACTEKRKTKIIIHATITEDNIDQLEDIIKLGKDLKVDGIRLGHPTFFTQDDCERNKLACQNLFPGKNVLGMSYIYNPGEKSKEFIGKIIKIRRKYLNEILFSPELNEEEIENWYSPKFSSKRKCHFIWRGTFVYPNGDVCPCESFYYPMGNINQEEFNKIWNNEHYRDFRKKLKKGLLPGCARCCKL